MQGRQVIPLRIREDRSGTRWKAVGSRAALVALSGLLVGGAAALAYWATIPEPARPAPRPAGAERKSALYCQFYVFVESRPYVAFLMEQEAGDAALLRQIYVAKADGDRTDYNAETGVRPEWRLDEAADPPRLEARIVVPAPGQSGLGEQDIAIEFPGARPDDLADRGSTRWREASLKSVYYQNLPGKCRRQNAP